MSHSSASQLSSWPRAPTALVSEKVGGGAHRSQVGHMGSEGEPRNDGLHSAGPVQRGQAFLAPSDSCHVEMAGSQSAEVLF